MCVFGPPTGTQEQKIAGKKLAKTAGGGGNHPPPSKARVNNV